MASGIRLAPIGDASDAPDASASLGSDAVLEVGYLLRKVLDASSQYAIDHPNTRAATTKLNERLLTILNLAPTLTIEVAPTQLLIGGRPLAKNNEVDLLAQSLFADGGRALVISRGMTQQQLTTFLDIAARRRSGGISDQSVTTEFWEAELPNIQLVVATTFADEEGEGLSTRRRSHGEVVKELMGVFTSPDLSKAAQSDELPTMINLSTSELEVLTSSNLAGIERSSLDAHDASARETLLGVGPETLHRLRERISAPRADAGERVLASLFDALVIAPADLKPKLSATLFQTVHTLILSKRFEPVARAFEFQLAPARTDQTIAAQRLPALTALRQAMIDASFVETLIASLDDSHLAPHAMPLLRIFGSTALDKVFDSVSKLTSDVGRQNISKLLEMMKPKPEVLLNRVKTATPDIAREIVLLCNKMPVATASPVLGALLQSPDANTRRISVRTLDRTMAPGVTLLLRKMVADPDRETRSLVIRLLAFTEDQASVEPMNRMLLRTTTDAAERKELYRALGEIGGPAAGDVLAAEFVRLPDTEAKVAVAMAFGRAWSPKAAAVLNDAMSKLLTAPKLKQACKTALTKGELRGKDVPASTGSGVFRAGSGVIRADAIGSQRLVGPEDGVYRGSGSSISRQPNPPPPQATGPKLSGPEDGVYRGSGSSIFRSPEALGLVPAPKPAPAAAPKPTQPPAPLVNDKGSTSGGGSEK